MPIERIPAGLAVKNRRANAAANWPTPDKGASRLLPIALPEVHPKFALTRQDKVFCIGSCFAREIEKHLGRIGFDVLSLDAPLPALDGRAVSDAGFRNKYTVGSILTEIERALEPDASSAEDCLVERADGTFEDYQLTGASFHAAKEDMLALRAGFEANFRRLREADVVVLTLGLSEAWRDLQTGLVLNKMPSPRLLAHHPDRFVLDVLSYDETRDALARLHDLFARHLKPGLRVLLTVSPVPLMTTFRDQDVMVANSYSKAVLRAAAEEFAHGKDHISYFPSFEMAGLSQHEAVWTADDYRHVHRDFVEVIMSHALGAFLPDAAEEMAARKALAAMRSLIRVGQPDAAAALADQIAADGPLGRDIARELARAKALTAKGAGGATESTLAPWFRMEKRLAEKMLPDRLFRKYSRNRDAFFEDSRSAALRLYGRKTR